MNTPRFTRRPIYRADMDLEVFVSGTITDLRGEDPVVDLAMVEYPNSDMVDDDHVASWAATLREKLLRSYAAF